MEKKQGRSEARPKPNPPARAQPVRQLLLKAAGQASAGSQSRAADRKSCPKNPPPADTAHICTLHKLNDSFPSAVKKSTQS